MLGCATDYFVISKRKGRSEMHFWMEFVKKTLRYYAVTCTFAMCIVHGSWRQASKTCTQWSHNFLRICAHRKSIYASDFSRQIPTSFARTPEVDLRIWFFSSNHNKSRSAFIFWDNFNVRFVWRIRIMSSKTLLSYWLFLKGFGPIVLCICSEWRQSTQSWFGTFQLIGNPCWKRPFFFWLTSQ